MAIYPHIIPDCQEPGQYIGVAAGAYWTVKKTPSAYETYWAYPDEPERFPTLNARTLYDLSRKLGEIERR